MGARDWHVARAERHKEVADHLAGAGHHDWAAVALFYSAHQWVHSSLADEPGLHKDERHPRKHTSPKGADKRGTNQMVRQIFKEISLSYASLFELSHRTRYDHDRLNDNMQDEIAYSFALIQYDEIQQFCEKRNATRQRVSTQAQWS